MDLALVSANTNQLRYILEYQDHHPYFALSLALVILSLFLQVAVGMTLLWNTRLVLILGHLLKVCRLVKLSIGFFVSGLM